MVQKMMISASKIKAVKDVCFDILAKATSAHHYCTETKNENNSLIHNTQYIFSHYAPNFNLDLSLSIGNLWFETLNLVNEILSATGNFNKYVSIFRFFFNIL